MSILIAILGIGVLILVHEAGHFLAAKAFGMRAEKFYIGFPPAAVKKRFGETEYGIGFVPLGGYVKISGMNREEEIPEEVVPRAYYSKPVWQRVIVISAGALMNLLLAFVLFAAVFYWQGVPELQATSVVASVQKNSGAAEAGVKPGDRLLSVNGVGFSDVEQLRSELKSRPDQPATIALEREGQTLTVTAQVGRNEETGEGLLGVIFDAEQIGSTKVGILLASRLAIGEMGFITKEVFFFIKNLFVSEEARQEIASPIGVVAISSRTVEMGVPVYLRVLGFISLQLAILNLLPLLPLDGGHVLFNVLEKIMGKPIRREVFEKVSFVGLAIVATLFIMGVFNDIQRLRGPGF